MIGRLRGHLPFVLPSVTIFVFCFAAPVAYFFVMSFWQIKSYQLSTDPTVHNYIEVWTDYFASLWYTFAVASVIALVVTAVAFGFAYFIRFKAGRWGTPLLFVALLTLFGGYLTKIYVWKTILGQGGVLNTALQAIGVVDEPITVFLYNPLAVVITLGHYTLPLAILPIYGALRSVDDVPLRCARDLGARPWQVFKEIVLPQCQVGILFSFTLTFLFAAGDYVTPLLVGGPYTSMMGIMIQLQFGMRYNAPMGAAMAFTIIAICMIVIGMVGLGLRQTLKARG
jgi:spermidine/putrescine transport system permease protein